jgi:hypothetical protein
MAVPKRNPANEILEIKSRSLRDDMSTRLSRLVDLTVSIESRAKRAKSVRAKEKVLLESYVVPIRLVAELQVFYKEQIAMLIDASDRYLANCSKFEHIKFRVDYLQGIRGSRFSIGEFVSHHLQIGSFEDVGSYCSTVIGDDYWSLLKPEPITVGSSTYGTIESNMGVIVPRLTELFAARNVIAHEAGAPPNHSPKDLFGYFRVVIPLFATSMRLFQRLKTAQPGATDNPGDAQ